MRTGLFALAIWIGLAGAAQAAVLRVTAEAPLSAERLGDALRSYLEGVEVDVTPLGGTEDARARMEPGVVRVILHGSHASGEDAAVVVVDGEETIIARLPGAARTEDLYRAAALKVEALLKRRASSVVVARPAGSVGNAQEPSRHLSADRRWLDAGVTIMLPSDGPARKGLRLGGILRLGQRWRLGLGTYAESPQSTSSQGVNVSAWEIPMWLSLGFAWHQDRWQGWLDGVGQAAVRRISAEAAGIVSNSDTTLSPRAGGALSIGVTLAPGIRATARVSMLATLADTRYRVDGQVVWPAARALLLCELGLEYGLR